MYVVAINHQARTHAHSRRTYSLRMCKLLRVRCMCVCMCKYGCSNIRQGSTRHVLMHTKALGYRGGLRVGDRLLSVNGAHCTDPSLATSMLKAAAGRVSLQVMRDLGGGSARSSQASPASMADAASPADVVVRSQSWAAKIKARLEAKAEAKAARERRIAAAMTAPTSEQRESASVRTVLRSPSFLQRLKRQSSSSVHQSSSSLRSPEESSHESPKPSPASSSRDKSPVGRASMHGLKEDSKESLNESSEFKPLPLTNTVEQLRTPLGANDAGGRRGSFGMTVSLKRRPSPNTDSKTSKQNINPKLNQVSPQNKPKSLKKQISHPTLGFRLVWNDAPKAPGGDAKVRRVWVVHSNSTAQHDTAQHRLCVTHGMAS